ncbi:YigZ family protein [Leuconostocaceae bacterium ESL0958]|nr:YigZ family protein [Leuconostocaceae bacterium ESL0958]
MEPYYLLKPEHGQWQQTIKKSDFIATVARVNSEEEAKAILADITKEHRTATHNVFAYVIGDQDEIKRYSDNGEPSGTAGVPILTVLQKQGVHNVLVVVTRYFGGIKLGAGGLIRAYAGTAAGALDALGLVERLTRMAVRIDIDYQNHNELTYWLEQGDYPILDTTFDTEVHQTVAVAADELPAFEQALTNRFAAQINFKNTGETYLEIPAK